MFIRKKTLNKIIDKAIRTALINHETKKHYITDWWSSGYTARRYDTTKTVQRIFNYLKVTIKRTPETTELVSLYKNNNPLLRRDEKYVKL